MKDERPLVRRNKIAPDGTGPHGKGLGPGKGKGDGTGLRKSITERENNESK